MIVTLAVYDRCPVAAVYDRRPVAAVYDRRPVAAVYDRRPVAAVYDRRPVAAVYDRRWRSMANELTWRRSVGSGAHRASLQFRASLPNHDRHARRVGVEFRGVHAADLRYPALIDASMLDAHARFKDMCAGR